jgi:hypothetical protein
MVMMIQNKEYDLSIFKQESSFHVDAFQLDDFIADAYCLENFEGTLESSNDTTHEYIVIKKLDEWNVAEVKEILKDGSCEHYRLGYVLDNMCAMDIIPEGKYYVRVCW